MTDNWDISFYGLNCAKCKMFESSDCQECRSADNNHCNPDCEIASCAEKRGFSYCFECPDFPCEKIKKFATSRHEHHRLAVKNIKQIKEARLKE